MLIPCNAGALLAGLAYTVVCLAQYCAGLQLQLEDYLDLPKLGEFDEPFHRSVRDALLALNIHKSTTSRVIMGQIERGESGGDLDKQPVYRVLANLKPHSKAPCSPDMTNLLKSLIGQMRAEPQGELSEKFSQFIMKDFGRENIVNCLMKFRSKFISFQKSEDLDEFDEFFMAGLELRGAAHETSRYQRNLELGNALRDVDLASERLNAGEMVKVVERSSGEEAASSSNRRHLLEEFVSDKCEKLRTSYSTELDNCNLATAIGEREILSPPVIKLNEYNRICLAWSKSEKRDSILANILGQV